MKFNLRKLGEITAISLASLALIVPLAGNVSTSVHAAHHSHYYYENLIYDPGSDMLSDEDEMQLIMQHPFLKHTHIVKMYFEGSPYWDGAAFDFYVRHFKQLYSPYLYPYMIKHVPYQNYANMRRDERILYKAQKQMGLLGHHRSRRHVRRQTHRHTHRNNRHHQQKRRRNHRSHRSHRR